LRRALERKNGIAVSDYDFRAAIRVALEELLGTSVPRPTEDQVRRRLRDNFKRRGLPDVFPNQRDRQCAYDLESAVPSAGEERP
jgi:hypothetical protein